DLDAEPKIIIDDEDNAADKLNRYSAMLKDRTFTLSQRISNICLLVNEKQFLSDERSHRDPLNMALQILNRLTERQNSLYEIVGELTERYGADPEQYQKDREAFEQRFSKWETVFQNVIANSLIYESFPYVDERLDETMAYRGLCAVYGLMRVVCVGYLATRNTNEDLVDAISALFHLIEHTSFYYNAPLIAEKAAVLLKL
nr:PqqD family protein [Erysipelotrichaceae bacterium]